MVFLQVTGSRKSGVGGGFEEDTPTVEKQAYGLPLGPKVLPPGEGTIELAGESGCQAKDVAQLVNLCCLPKIWGLILGAT